MHGVCTGDQRGHAACSRASAAGAAMRRAVVDDPEDAPRRAIGLLRHDLLDQAVERRDAGRGLAAAEDGARGARPTRPDRPRRRAARTRARRAAAGRARRARGMAARRRAWMLVFSSAEITYSCGPSGRPSQRRGVEIQDGPGLVRRTADRAERSSCDGARPDRIGVQPAPERGAADRRDQAAGQDFPAQIGQRPARQRHARHPSGARTRSA